MRRFRIAIALVAAVLLGAVGLLVARALESVDLERRVRHETVAERVFDEMERALSSFVASEEERPFEAYGVTSPPLPFVVGYFEIAPNGTIHSPSPPASAARREIVELAGRAWATEPKADPAASQAPGSTVQLRADAPQQELAASSSSDAQVSAYDALRSLNKGVEQRAERQSKIVGSTAIDDASRVELAPLEGRRVGTGRLVLVRTAMRGTDRYRQGLLVDLGRLGRWLGEQSVGASELESRVTLDFEPAASGRSREAGGLVYQHRFAEPFATLTARLTLTPLEELGADVTVHALSVFALGAILLGLAALYRMTSVVLRYAEQRSNFVAAVTHELKTPLTAIRMYGEMLRDGIVPSEAKRAEYYRHITAESERLTRLVNNVLEFSRLEKGSRNVSLEAGDLGATVREVATLVRPHVEGAGFALDVHVEPALPAVRFERDALMQILFNLVDNAVKYADGAAPKSVELRCTRDGGTVRLTVRDHGPGVPASHLARIFEPFVRADNELTRRTTGTGLGLALVRGLAERMNARVTGRNATGGGFEVEIRFA